MSKPGQLATILAERGRLSGRVGGGGTGGDGGRRRVGVLILVVAVRLSGLRIIERAVSPRRVPGGRRAVELGVGDWGRLINHDRGVDAVGGHLAAAGVEIGVDRLTALGVEGGGVGFLVPGELDRRLDPLVVWIKPRGVFRTTGVRAYNKRCPDLRGGQARLRAPVHPESPSWPDCWCRTSNQPATG